ILTVLPRGPPRTRLRRIVRQTQSCQRPAKRRNARTTDVLGDSSDEERVEVISLPTPRRLQVTKARAKPSRVRSAPVRRPARRHRQAAPSESRRGHPKPKQRPKPSAPRPAVVELDDEDQVIETCIPYEEAFFGYMPKSQPSALDAEWQGPATEEEAAAVAAPASELPEEPPAELTPAADSEAAAVPAAPQPLAPSSPLQAEDPAPQDEEQVSAQSAAADAPAAPSCPELPKVDLPETLELPKAAEPSPIPRPPEPPPEPKVFTSLPDIGQEETRLPEPRYSEVYVECVRNSALFDRCCVCWKSFSAGQLRLGYVPTVSLSEEPRWVHAPRCLTGDGLRLEPRSNFAAFAPSVPLEEQQRILTVLSLLRPSLPARDAEHPVLRPRLWRWGPAISQRWLRCAVPAPGAPRVLVQSERRYTAPNPSTLSRLARTLLVQGLRQRPSDEVVARATRRIQRSSAPRREPTATSQRPRTEAPAQDEGNNRGRRQWRRRSALGDRAEEFFAIAPVLTLDKDVTEEEPCVICHEQLMAGDDVRRLPCCHMFHRSCIDRWMHTKAVCPLDKLTAAELIAAALGERGSAASTGSGATAPASSAGTAR
ncbi:HIP1, partial [Symbiodinium sp. CCMP2456]